jgi:predicted  nucleic acid-binding Zn-ribbon protein
MTVTPTIEQLRKDIESARTDLTRLEGQQESAQEELVKLEEEAQNLGIDPAHLTSEAVRIMDDVAEALVGIREEMQVLVKETEHE